MRPKPNQNTFGRPLSTSSVTLFYGLSKGAAEIRHFQSPSINFFALNTHKVNGNIKQESAFQCARRFGEEQVQIIHIIFMERARPIPGAFQIKIIKIFAINRHDSQSWFNS